MAQSRKKDLREMGIASLAGLGLGIAFAASLMRKREDNDRSPDNAPGPAAPQVPRP